MGAFTDPISGRIAASVPIEALVAAISSDSCDNADSHAKERPPSRPPSHQEDGFGSPCTSPSDPSSKETGIPFSGIEK